MDLIFSDCKKGNQRTDALDFQYLYTIDGQDDSSHVFHAVLLVDTQAVRSMGGSEEQEYSRKGFAVAIDYIKEHWNRSGELPSEDIEYVEGTDLRSVSERAVNWKGYRLKLS